MMKFKKFLAAAMTGAMMLGVVASAAPTMSVYAAEDDSNGTQATTGNYDITIDYKTMTAEITLKDNAQKDPYVKLVVIKKDKESETDEKKASSGVYTYAYPASGSLTVDLSFLKLTKPATIRVYGSSQTFANASEAKVNAQGAKISLSYTGGTGDIAKAFKVGKGKNAQPVSAEQLAEYEFRTLYGSEFKDLTAANFKVDVAEMAGTTLVVRKKAVTTEKETKDNPACAASPEIKVKISAAPKAPSIKIDYKKGTISSFKNTKVEIYTSSGSAIQLKGENVVSGSAIFNDKAKAYTPEALLKYCGVEAGAKELLGSGFIVVVKTVKANKADSNAAIVPIPSSAEITASQVSTTASGGAITVDTSTKLEWAFGENTKKKKDGLTFTNVSGNFEYEDPKKEGTWKAIKKDTFLENATTVNIRVAGIKDDETLPSQSYPIKKEGTGN